VKTTTGTLIVVILLSTCIPGCSSIRARNGSSAQQWNVYPGTRQDVQEIGEIVSGQRKDPLWVQAIVTTILLVDLPVSSLFDTLAAPYDLYRNHRPGQASAEAGKEGD